MNDRGPHARTQHDPKDASGLEKPCGAIDCLVDGCFMADIYSDQLDVKRTRCLMFRVLSRAVSIAKSAIRSPNYGRENGTENQERYQNERRNVSLPGGIIANHNPEEGHQQSNDPNCEDSQANFGLGSKHFILSEITPKPSLVPHRVGKDDVALSRFNVLDPFFPFVMFTHWQERLLIPVIWSSRPLPLRKSKRAKNPGGRLQEESSKANLESAPSAWRFHLQD